MLEAKWKIDTEQGRGFSKRIENQGSFFNTLEISNYPFELVNYLKNNYKTNGEIYMFGLEKGYLPKHSIEILKPYRINNKLIVKDLNGNVMPKNGYYLSYEHYKNNSNKTVKYYLT